MTQDPRVPRITRRAVLGALAGWLLLPGRVARGETETRRAPYTARTTLLYGLLRFEMTGTIEETVDRAAGRYEVRIGGQGSDMTADILSRGALRDGRWTPIRFQDRFSVHGRESRLEIDYDHARRTVTYHGRSETFLLRRLRVADDVVRIPDGMHVDDVVSAALNHADDRWPREADGTLVTHVVRRRRGVNEGSDDVERAYRVEVVPFVLRITSDPETGRPGAAFDLTRFSSWAREGEPARIVFGADRRPEGLRASLMLGTSISVRIGSPAAAAS